jgi:hypothetical protein
MCGSLSAPPVANAFTASTRTDGFSAEVARSSAAAITGSLNAPPVANASTSRAGRTGSRRK